jgi:ribosome maturation factor RimP
MVEKLSPADEQLERITEQLLGQLGYELVDLEKAGQRARPILRLRIDRIDGEPGQGITVDECARVSREFEAALEEREDLQGGYILEVSSPGVDRPLRKLRDFERSIGREIAVRGYQPLCGGSKRLEGELLAVEGDAGSEILRLKLSDEAEVEIPFSAIAKANLVFNWDEFDFGSTQS